MTDVILMNANCFFGRGRSEVTDLAVTGERIGGEPPPTDEDRVGEPPTAGASEPRKLIDLSGLTVLPAFVDVHTHLDKTLLAGVLPNGSGTLDGAVASYRPYFAGVSAGDVIDRATRAVDMAVANGTGAMRTHPVINTRQGLRFVKAVLEVKAAVADRLDLQVVAMTSSGDDRRETMRLLERALEAGADLIGGAPEREADPRRYIDDIFSLAKAAGVPIDLHVDETDEPTVDALEYLAVKTIAEGYQGKVTAGHCTSLARVPQNVADRVIAKVREAGISVVTLPSCNLFLMSRGGPHPFGRGITRVGELLEAGVNVAYASDNVRDPFRPFGNADMLQEGLLTAQVTQKGYPRDLLEVLEMGTYNPAKIMGLTGPGGYGLEPGCSADLVVLDAPDPAEALLSQARKVAVLHRGRVVAGELPE